MIFDFFLNYFERPLILLLIIPLILLMLYLFKKEFVKLYLGGDYEVKRKKLKWFVLIIRFIILVLVLIAIASPFIQTTKVITGDPKIKIVVDNSTSMELFDLGFADNLKKQLENQIPVEVSFIASGEESKIGDGILSNMKKNSNLLLITDGNNNEGVDLGDVAIQANALNSSISALKIIPNKYDASVSVYGSQKTTSGSENTFTVSVQQTENKNPRLVVDVDGNMVIDRKVTSGDIPFKMTFTEGYHKITAKIDASDYFKQNNLFYKTVKVVPKPKVLLLSSNEELLQLFGPIYDLNKVENLDGDFSGYTGIIIDDKDAANLNSYYDKLSSFISSGNGLLVIGGGNSYDSGNYTASKFEQLLPVFTAKAGRKKGEMNIILLLDVSGSTGLGFEGYTKVDVEKALAINMLNTLNLVNNVGVIAFNTYAYNVADVKPLLEQVDLNDKITKLQFSGGTDIATGMKAAIASLQNRGGSKNIILLSDGNTQNKDATIDVVKYASSHGINVYSIGVGGDTDADFMQKISDFGNGIYFEPDTSQQIKLLFGETEIPEGKKVFSLTIIDRNHFITKGLNLSANIYGFNQVVPKTTAKMLVSTDLGDPILSVWRYGLGRVASLAVDYKIYGFEILNKQNSLLLTRVGNWIIGDPERNNKRFIDITDGEINKPIEVVVKADAQPTSKEVALYKIDQDLYKGTIFVDKTGFNSVIDGVFAVNYNTEYQNIGINSELGNLVSSTGGKLFDPEDVEGIINFVKQKSRREILINKSYSWWFLLGGMILFLIEIFIRRLITYKVI